MRFEAAASIAAIAHEGMVDKAGAPYIGHCLRVAAALIGEPDKVVGVLHDVIEDCDINIDDPVLADLNHAERVALDAISKRPGEDYVDYLKRVAANPIARRVKLADLDDNCRLERIDNPSDKDRERVEKYKVARLYLESVDYF